MITPLQDYVVVRPIQRKRSEVLTVITSETDQGSWGAYADVIAVGPGLPNKRGNIMPLDVKIGDRVMYGGDRLGCINFPKYVEDGVEYRVIQEADVCFVERIVDDVEGV